MSRLGGRDDGGCPGWVRQLRFSLLYQNAGGKMVGSWALRGGAGRTAARVQSEQTGTVTEP